MRAGACRFDDGSEWYNAYKAECLLFTGASDAKTDDQFDATAILHKGLEMAPEVEDDDFLEEEDEEFEEESRNARSSETRSCTGY